MAELHNFTAHLKRIVGPVLKARGFKMKGTRFLRTMGGFSDEIYIQRSQWNMADSECELYVNLYADLGTVLPSATSLGSMVRLDRPSSLEYPAYYRDYMNIPYGTSERELAWASLSANQKDYISELVRSTRWVYTSEASLSQLFESMVASLETVGMDYFEQIHRVLPGGSPPELGKFAYQWKMAQDQRNIKH